MSGRSTPAPPQLSHRKWAGAGGIVSAMAWMPGSNASAGAEVHMLSTERRAPSGYASITSS
jgi:hypothetical protein